MSLFEKINDGEKLEIDKNWKIVVYCRVLYN